MSDTIWCGLNSISFLSFTLKLLCLGPTYKWYKMHVQHLYMYIYLSKSLLLKGIWNLLCCYCYIPDGVRSSWAFQLFCLPWTCDRRLIWFLWLSSPEHGWCCFPSCYGSAPAWWSDVGCSRSPDVAVVLKCSIPLSPSQPACPLSGSYTVAKQ